MRKFLPILLIFIAFNVQAQSILTPEDAIKIAIKNNYDVLIATNEATISKTNNTAGNAGMLPNVSATGTQTLTQSNIRTQQANAGEVAYPNTSSVTTSAGLLLSWTVFDGGKMFITRKKLGEQEVLSESLLKEKILQTIYGSTLAYYDVVKQKQQLAYINKVLEYNKERVKILQIGYNSGLSSKTNMLQAKIDLNVAQENAINQQAVILSAKRALNLVLARDSDELFDVVDSVSFQTIMPKDELLKKAFTSNTSIVNSQKLLSIAGLNAKEYNRLRWPKVSINAGYNMSLTDNTGSNVNFNHNYGPMVAANIAIPLYQAGNNLRQVKIAQLQALSANCGLESIRKQVYTQLINAYTQWENQQKLLEIERENAVLAKENLEISIERLRLGQTTSLETRQAQQSYEDSQTRLINFQYNLKVAETKIKQLVADL